MATKMEMTIAALVFIGIIVSASALWYGMSVLSDVSTLKGDVADLASSMTALAGNMTDLTGAMAELTGELASLAETVGTSLEAIEDIQDRLTALEDRLETLEDRLEDVERRLRPTVTVIGPWAGPEKAAFMPVLEAFEEEKGINVKYKTYRAEDLATILPAQFDIGLAPGDVIFMWPWYIKQIGPQGIALDVTTLINETDFSPGALDPVKVGDTIYGGAYTGKVKPGFWYRKSFFQAHGLTEPTTWEEFETLLEDIAAIEGIEAPILSGDGIGWPLSDVTEHFIITFGGPDLQRDLINGTVDWTSAEVKTTIFEEKLVPLLEAGYFSDPIDWDSPGIDYWWDGEYALYFMGSWITGMVEDPNDLGVFSLPGCEGLVFAADYCFVPKWAENPDGAEELFKFLMSAEAQELQVAQGGHLATNIHVSLDAYPAVDREVAELLEGVELLLDLDDTIGGEFQTTFFEQLSLLWVHPEDLDDVIDAIQAKAP